MRSLTEDSELTGCCKSRTLKAEGDGTGPEQSNEVTEIKSEKELSKVVYTTATVAYGWAGAVMRS